MTRVGDCATVPHVINLELNEPTTCSNCGSDLLEWGVSNRPSLVSQGGTVEAYLGCIECSETLRVVDADTFMLRINAILNAVVPV